MEKFIQKIEQEIKKYFNTEKLTNDQRAFFVYVVKKHTEITDVRLAKYIKGSVSDVERLHSNVIKQVVITRDDEARETLTNIETQIPIVEFHKFRRELYHVIRKCNSFEDLEKFMGRKLSQIPEIIEINKTEENEVEVL